MIIKIIVRTILFIVLFALYLISTVPVGLFLYSMKSDLFGLNIFSKTGFHAYMHCLREQAAKIEFLPEKKESPQEAYQREIQKKNTQHDPSEQPAP